VKVTWFAAFPQLLFVDGFAPAIQALRFRRYHSHWQEPDLIQVPPDQQSPPPAATGNTNSAWQWIDLNDYKPGRFSQSWSIIVGTVCPNQNSDTRCQAAQCNTQQNTSCTCHRQLMSS